MSIKDRLTVVKGIRPGAPETWLSKLRFAFTMLFCPNAGAGGY